MTSACAGFRAPLVYSKLEKACKMIQQPRTQSADVREPWLLWTSRSICWEKTRDKLMSEIFRFCHGIRPFRGDACRTVPLCCLDIVGFKNEIERLFVVELELQRLRRFGLQLKAEQRLTLQGRDVLREDVTHLKQSSQKKIKIKFEGTKAYLSWAKSAWYSFTCTAT